VIGRVYRLKLDELREPHVFTGSHAPGPRLDSLVSRRGAPVAPAMRPT
jgi:hypothetical protein